MNYSETLNELLEGSSNWGYLKNNLQLFNTAESETTSKKTTAGKLFELFAKAYFIVDPKQNQIYRDVWLFDEIPLSIKQQLNFPIKDFGVDLLLKDRHDRFTAVQCKFKNDEQSVLQWSKDKLGNAFGLAEKCDYVLFFTNASNVHQVAQNQEKLKFIGYSDLIEINHEVYAALRNYLSSKTLTQFHKHTPLNHQKQAIKDVLKHFETNDRGQLILPCGAGKTLTALWIKEKLSAKNSLVLFPSLALLRQFKDEWAWHKNDDFDYICVCSERDIDKSTDDPTVIHTWEISGDVTTNPNRLNEFLSQKGSKVVFSTYQSVKCIEEALKLTSDFNFDLIICDEAHRTSGDKTKSTFTIVHDNKRVKANKRLYMTATPKVVSNKLKTRLGEDYELLCDMSKPAIFGAEAHRMSFGEAIARKILVDYKIIGIGVTHKQVKEFIDQRRYVNPKYSIDEIAHNYALDIVMNKYEAFHAITFHSKVKFAREFSERHKSFFQPEVYSEYVEGNQPTSYRSLVLKEFKDNSKGIVSNARCLTEGVDVPVIDLIYFCDPKTSKIDIVQASGRALRKDKHGKKKEGYIVVPIFHYKDDDVEKEIEKKPYFQNLIAVIRSLCDQDERLQAEIDDVAFAKGERKSKRIEITYNDDEIEKIIKLEGLDKRIKEFLFDQIIEKTRNFWEVQFKKLIEYQKKHGHTNVSRKQPGMVQLGNWVLEQRRQYHSGKLNPEKKKRLNEIGFDWKGENRRAIKSRDDNWKFHFQKLKKYFDENGHSDVPFRHEPDRTMAIWVVQQRVKFRNKKLQDWQINTLKEVDFDFDPKNVFPRFIKELKMFRKKHGHVVVPIQSKEYKWLGKQVNKIRVIYNSGTRDKKGNIISEGKGKVLKRELEELNSIGFVWNASKGGWDERYEELVAYFNQNGHSNVPQSENSSLYYWSYKNRRWKSRLSPEQVAKLQKLNFDFDLINRAKTQTVGWDERFDELKNLKKSTDI